MAGLAAGTTRSRMTRLDLENLPPWLSLDRPNSATMHAEDLWGGVEAARLLKLVTSAPIPPVTGTVRRRAPIALVAMDVYVGKCESSLLANAL